MLAWDQKGCAPSYIESKGRTDDEIVVTFYLMFQDDKINANELSDLLGLVGYKLNDDFLDLSPEQQKHIFDEDYDPLGDVINELYYLCSYDIINQKQLTDILKILNRNFNNNYLERFKIKKERANKED